MEKIVERDTAAEAERMNREAAEKIADLEAGYQEISAAFAAWQDLFTSMRKARLFGLLVNTFSACFPLDRISPRLRGASPMKSPRGGCETPGA